MGCGRNPFISVLISIALFTVSKVAIGSLCPVCLSTYLTCILLLIACHFWRGSDTFGARIRSGMAAVLFSPLILLGLGGPAKAAEARLASLSLLLVLSTTLFLPDFLFVQFIKERGELRKSELAQQAVANWRSAEPVTFDFKEEGLEKDHSKGPDQALIAVAEFSDFECPSCRIFYFMLEPLLEEYAGKVRLTLLNYPLDKSCNPGIHGDFHKSACLAAFATRCAGEQGEFWKMADYIFKMEELDAPEASLEEVRAALLHGAEALNLDRQAFDECLQSGRHAAKIASDIELGNRLGVKGTPSLWINGRKVEVLTIQGLRSIFDEILKAKPTN
ncbi:MAG: hypothetical protein DCC75_13425 [Proteobacteria bacterium]|nr:MAG: hypothetical protein DCC75_13425 [Pseudomonadota bacterium]